MKLAQNQPMSHSPFGWLLPRATKRVTCSLTGDLAISYPLYEFGDDRPIARSLQIRTTSQTLSLSLTFM